jgi:hypothetical protein
VLAFLLRIEVRKTGWNEWVASNLQRAPICTTFVPASETDLFSPWIGRSCVAFCMNCRSPIPFCSPIWQNTIYKNKEHRCSRRKCTSVQRRVYHSSAHFFWLDRVYRQEREAWLQVALYFSVEQGRSSRVDVPSREMRSPHWKDGRQNRELYQVTTRSIFLWFSLRSRNQIHRHTYESLDCMHKRKRYTAELSVLFWRSNDAIKISFSGIIIAQEWLKRWDVLVCARTEQEEVYSICNRPTSFFPS